jgi:Nucleotidyl transferase AbiEii toxin, Type IV TA system
LDYAPELVRAQLLARSRAESTDHQILLTRYALERLLYRLSISEHRERFVLKGALLFITWAADTFRPTRDLDLLGYDANSREEIADTFKTICSTAVPNDGVAFDIDGLTAASIREDLAYGGVRVQTYAVIDRARIPIQVDIGFGDVITPCWEGSCFQFRPVCNLLKMGSRN